jgi:hypothetical protein
LSSSASRSASWLGVSSCADAARALRSLLSRPAASRCASRAGAVARPRAHSLSPSSCARSAASISDSCAAARACALTSFALALARSALASFFASSSALA